MTEPFSFDAFCDRCDRPIRCREHIGTLCTHCAKPVITKRISAGRWPRMKGSPGGASTPLVPGLTTQGVAMQDSSATTDTPCHVGPLEPEHYCPECGTYNPNPLGGDE